MIAREYKVRLSGVLPPDDLNGWDNPTLAADFDRDRARTRYALIAYKIHKTDEVTDTGDRIFIIRVQGLEPVLNPEQVDQVEADMQSMFEHRTGHTTLFGLGGSTE